MRISRFSFQRRMLCLAATSLAIASATGCVRRRLTVRTNPPGALVSVDNQIIGTTPAATAYTFYGTREIRVEKDGYRTETVRRAIDPPWYQFPPLDFITETLWPWEIRDERIIDVQLVPRQAVPAEEVVGRADQLRSQSRSGVVTGPLSQPTPVLPAAPAGSLRPAPADSQPLGLPPGGVPARLLPQQPGY